MTSIVQEKADFEVSLTAYCRKVKLDERKNKARIFPELTASVDTCRGIPQTMKPTGTQQKKCNANFNWLKKFKQNFDFKGSQSNHY